MTLLTAVVIASSVLAGLVRAVFFAFSVFVMRALAEEPPGRGISVMQRINVTVINPLLLGAFLRASPLLAAVALRIRTTVIGACSRVGTGSHLEYTPAAQMGSTQPGMCWWELSH